MSSDEYRPMTEEEEAQYEAQMDAAMDRAADEHYKQEAEEYEKVRPMIERETAAILATPALLPFPWVRAVEVRDLYPCDVYRAEAGPFRIEIAPDFVDDEDGGWPTWRWDVTDTRLEANGVYGDDRNIGRAAREAVECCRDEFEPAPEAFAQLVVLAVMGHSCPDCTDE